MSEQRDIQPVSIAEDTASGSDRNVIATIGIDRYQGWQRLTNAVGDARGAMALFQRLGFEQITEPLIDGNATGKAIRELVTDDLRTLGPDDSLVIFYAGHGGVREHSLGSKLVKTGYLIPVDASDRAATWIDLDGWLRAVSLLPAKHILVILDACHSGIALGEVIRWRDTGTWQNTPLPVLQARRSRRIITSALDDQMALDSGPVHGHSLFTGCLIEGLTHGLGRAGSRLATGSELGLYLQRRVETYPNSRQTPDFGTFGFDERGELVIPFLMQEAPPPPPDIEDDLQLAERYFRAQDWAALSPVIEKLIRNAGQLGTPPHARGQLYHRAARAAEELGDYQKALTYYEAAYDLDSTYLPALIGRADLLFKMAQYVDAGKIYQTILISRHDILDESVVVYMHHRLGLVQQALGERKKALDNFEKALDLDPIHRDTLHAVIDLRQQQGDWEAVIHAKRGLSVTSLPEEKARLLDQIADIYHNKLQNPQQATAAYLEALEFAPENHQLLQKLLDIYTETKQWKKAIETIGRLITLESDPVRLGQYYHAAATVYRDELKSLDAAVDHYSKALDNFFTNPERLPEGMIPRALMSFEMIDKIMMVKRDWKRQERLYHDMIKRLPKQNSAMFHKVRVRLFDSLGELYRSRLKHYQPASQAYEIAQQLDPANELRADGTDRAEILAELYLVLGPEHADKAVEQHMRMLRQEPFKYDSYKALRRIYMDAHQYDKTWCVCNTLAFLKKADPDELQFYEQYKPRGLVKAKNVMSADTWSKLAHPDENRYISAIFGACWQGVAAMKAFPHKEFGIKRKDKRVLPGDPLMFSKLFYYVAQVLNVPLPEVFLVEDNKPADIQLVNAIEKSELCPSFVVRPHLLQGKSEREIAFLSACRLTFMRPEYYLKLMMLTNSEFKLAMLSAIAMVRPQFPVPTDMASLVQQYVPKIQKHMPPQMLRQLDAVVGRFIEAAPELNLTKWDHAVDVVSHRAGFVVCGDLEVAARIVSVEPVLFGGPQVKDKIQELVLYSVSEEYFAVRAQMGLTIAG